MGARALELALDEEDTVVVEKVAGEVVLRESVRRMA
jgi:LacI family transcriptional regulator